MVRWSKSFLVALGDVPSQPHECSHMFSTSGCSGGSAKHVLLKSRDNCGRGKLGVPWRVSSRRAIPIRPIFAQIGTMRPCFAAIEAPRVHVRDCRLHVTSVSTALGWPIELSTESPGGHAVYSSRRGSAIGWAFRDLEAMGGHEPRLWRARAVLVHLGQHEAMLLTDSL